MAMVLEPPLLPTTVPFQVQPPFLSRKSHDTTMVEPIYRGRVMVVFVL